MGSGAGGGGGGRSQLQCTGIPVASPLLRRFMGFERLLDVPGKALSNNYLLSIGDRVLMLGMVL